MKITSSFSQISIHFFWDTFYINGKKYLIIIEKNYELHAQHAVKQVHYLKRIVHELKNFRFLKISSDKCNLL